MIARAPLLSVLSVLLFSALPPSWAGSWLERAGKMNRREISAGEARDRGSDEKVDRRNKLCVRRIAPAMAGVDWDADPTAIPYMMYQMGKRTDLPVHIDNDGLDVGSRELFEQVVVYLTSHGRWALNEREVENMSAWLKRGGTLVLDDCYNRGSAFSDCVRPETAKLIPGVEPIMVLEEDPRVADMFKMIYPTGFPGKLPTQAGENRPWQYFVLDDRPAVLFCPNDDGCAWEVSSPPTASNPLGEPIGHGGDNRWREIVYQWAANWMLYVYTH